MPSITLIVLFIVSFATAWFISHNPFLFGKSVDSAHSYSVTTHQDILDSQLESLQPSIGDDDFVKYRNHCLRVYNFANFFLSESVKEEMPNYPTIMAVALAFHDVGLWTDGALDYLDPSVAQMYKHNSETHILNDDELVIASAMIEQHHKVTLYVGGNETVNALVNAVRKGDWTDFSVGVIRWNVPAGLVEQVFTELPELGFHKMLFQMLSLLSPNSLLGQLDILKIFKW